VATATFDDPFEPVFRALELVVCALLPPDDRDDELPLRRDEAEERRLDALAVFGLLRELELLLLVPLRLLLAAELRDFGLDPFEL
jgi:hypothetical protein